MKKTLTKILSVMLIVCITLTSASLSGLVGLDLPDWLDFSIKSSAATSGTCGDNLIWNYDDSTYTLTISGTGAMTDYSSSNRPWESYEDSIKTIVIEDGITSIGRYAFYYYTSLTSVTIGDGVTTIGYGAFYYCTSLTSVTIPDSVTSIGDYAFFNCTSLTSVTIPDSVTTIGKEAFSYCESLISITIPDSVITIDKYAFYNCTSLTSITIPDSVTTIGFAAFYYCTSLTDVYYSGTEEQWNAIAIGELNDPLINATIHFNSSGGDIPDDDDITSDKSGTCGNNLTWSLDNNGVLTISGAGDMYNWNNVGEVSWSTVREEIQFIIVEDGVTTIGNHAFESCTNCTSVVIPDSVEIIGVDALSWCNSLTKITLPDSITTINEGAFSFCTSLTDTYYSGTTSEWNNVSIGLYNSFLFDSIIHFNSTGNNENADTCHLSGLTDIDYLAFSDIAYKSIDYSENSSENNIISVRDIIGESKWKNEYWKETDIKYRELYANIENWTVYDFAENDETGFGAYIFKNDYDEFVVAFRGSINISENLLNLLNPDWTQNDIPMFFGGNGSQIEETISFVEELVEEYGADSIYITGHSLGGALCDIVSARYDCYAESFNAAPFLANAYYHYPDEMGQLFSGVENLKFVDHVTESDFVGELSLWIKNYIIHEYNGSEKGTHSLTSLINKNSEYNLSLTQANPTSPSPKSDAIFDSCLYIGTKRSDSLLWPQLKLNAVVYGGDSSDEISTGFGVDALIGGKGNDILDGGYGNDSYYYYKGDGIDFIWDVDGEINIYLYDFNENDKFEGIEHPGNRWLYCNDELILMISEQNPINIFIYDNDKNIIENLKYNSNSSELYNPVRWMVACPVNVEIINDANNEVVYTLYDGTEGAYYTDYGYFYVYQDENGDYVKIADLYEGYSIRIVGTDTGTMDVSVLNLAGGEDGSTFSAVNVPVTSSLVATIEEIDNEKYLVIDFNGDGNIDNRVQLVEEIEYSYTFSIQSPSRTEIRHKDGIKLHTNIEGTAPAGSYVEWTASNGNFKTEQINNGNSLKIISDSNGYTTFTATLYNADGEVLATDTIEMKSKAGFFDKIGSFFRSLFGSTKIYEK